MLVLQRFEPEVLAGERSRGDGALARPPGSPTCGGRSRYLEGLPSGGAKPNERYRPCASEVCSIQRHPAPGPSSIIIATMARPRPAPRWAGSTYTSDR